MKFYFLLKIIWYEQNELIILPLSVSSTTSTTLSQFPIQDGSCYKKYNFLKWQKMSKFWAEILAVSLWLWVVWGIIYDLI
jgi:hypothetical protein